MQEVVDDIIDLDRYPLHRSESAEWLELVHLCRSQLADDGMFELAEFLLPQTLARTVAAATQA